MVLSTETLVSKRQTIIENGLYLGTDQDQNYPSSKNNPTKFSVGSAYTQGQEVKSLYNLNKNGPLIYDPTTLDQLNLTTEYSEIFNDYPNLLNYPYLTIPFDNDINNIITTSKEYPLFKTLGKCFGELEFFKTSSNDPGLVEFQSSEYMSFYYSNIFNGRILIADPQNYTRNKYPFSGLLYSGNLVQLQINSTNKNIEIIPYQNGRGIPQYDPTQEYFSGNAYGIPYWPSLDIKLEPELATGAVTGNNNACLGVTTDTTLSKEKVGLYKYTNENSIQLNKLPWIKWDQHPAPFTAPPVNISFTSNERIFSPENSNGNYYAPWPNYYAYQEGDPTPVCCDGVVTLNIGAATNIGAQAYYEPDVVEGDNPINNPNYISVSIIPLFQGEKINVGNYVYASVMGNIITPKPEGTTPYPAPTYDDACGLLTYTGTELNDFSGIQRDGRRDNPYYDYFDPTYGAVGWTSTPQFLLSSIPDQQVSIIETRNENGPVSLPYLNQSNQGSSIIQAVTTEEPLSENGSGRMMLIGPGEYTETLNEKFKRITRFNGTPGRSVPIGKTLEDIEGTGQWTYTGTINDFEQTTYVNGVRYSTGIVNTTNGSGSGATVNITSVDSNGTVLTASLNSAGSGYLSNEPVTLTVTPTTEWAQGTLNYFQNCASVFLNPFSINTQGSNYKSSIYETCFNTTANNLIVEATVSSVFLGALITRVQSVSIYNVSDVTRYPVGTQIAIINDANKSNWAIIEVDSNDGVNITVSLDPVKAGGRNVYQTGTYLYATEIVGFNNVTTRIEANESGQITSVECIELPTGNKEGDLLLIPQRGSDKNFIFSLENNVSRINTFSSKLIKGGTGYLYNNSFLEDVYYQPGSDPFFILNTNDAIVLNPGLIDSGASISIGNTEMPVGNITQAMFDPVVSTYTGEFGNIQTIKQTYKIGRLNNQPVPSSVPDPEGWPSYIHRQTATFYQDVRYFIQKPGSGYVVGGPYNTTGGSGTGMTVFILKTTSGGQVEKVKVNSIGTGYLKEDRIVISSGNNDCELKLKLPIGRELILVSQANIAPLLVFNPIIIDPGTGYTVGNNIPTSCPIYDGNTFGASMNLKVNILEVGTNGEILDLEIVQPETDNTSYYQIDYNLIIEDGDTNALIKLDKPIKASLMKFTNGGTNYTTESNVSTFNQTQNNLATICGLETTGAGECEVFDYTPADLSPPFWDLSRYQVGDIIAFNQNGNISATAEITFIDLATQSISFNQLSFGVGYVQDVVSDYSYLPTINLSQTATTVDITTDTNGTITHASINTLGTNTEYNDALIIEQTGSDHNAVILIASERDVPAPWQPFENGRVATSTEWNEYKNVMKSAINLSQKQIIVDFKKMYPNFYNNSWYYYGDPDNKDPCTAGIQFQLF